MLASEVAVVKSHHGISVKCSRYRDTGPTDPSLFSTGCKNQLKVVLTLRGELFSGGEFIMSQIYLQFTKYLQYITHMY